MEHFVNQPTQERFEETPGGGQAVKVCEASGIGHLGELVSEGIEKLLLGFLTTHVVPFAVRLSNKIMKVTKVPGLKTIELLVP
jgi:hypothetical protein